MALANIPLKTIDLPVLPDTYYVPQVDDTLTLGDCVAQAKATGDAIAATSDMIAPEYSFMSPYYVGQYVTHERALYRCKVNIPYGESWNSAHWAFVRASDLFESPNYALYGRNLKNIFGSADNLHDALYYGDYSSIHIGDYWPVTLNGIYRDYSDFSCPSGVSYYSNTALTTLVGTTSSSYDATCFLSTTLPSCLNPYASIKIDNTTYYVALSDCLPYRTKTISGSVIYFEVAGINQYWKYGDSGDLAGNTSKPHILFCARNGFAETLKMRKQDTARENTHVASFEGDGYTSTFAIDDTIGTIGDVFVNGTKQTYGTHYEYGSSHAQIKFKTGYIPTNAADIKVGWMEGTTPWNGSALYQTFNDQSFGIISLIHTADPDLYDGIYTGPNSKGMRLYSETRTKSGIQKGVWADRGCLFLPTEDEVWGRPLYSYSSDLPVSISQLQWPIFSMGGRRHFANGMGDEEKRCYIWTQSSYSQNSFASVDNTGIPSYSSAGTARTAAPSFIFV